MRPPAPGVPPPFLTVLSQPLTSLRSCPHWNAAARGYHHFGTFSVRILNLQPLPWKSGFPWSTREENFISLCFHICSLGLISPSPEWNPRPSHDFSDHSEVGLRVSPSVISYSLWAQGLWPAGLLCSWNPPGKNMGVGSHSLLQGVFPTQGSNPDLLHWRQILYHLSHQGSPIASIKTKHQN